ncbi:hypothetical protein CEE39_08390 [bacterium (candidate division B38) B3_B38]|nr:MAG: hypothetical protein CEE39_08390 [bacterium (candidate division B38) B3_B38]
MSKYPPKIIDSAFRHALKRGAIICTVWEYEIISKPKFFITLNKDLSLDVIYFFPTTSKIDWFNKHPKHESDIIRIPPKEISCFYLYTIIDCRQECYLAKSKLKKRFQEGELEFKEYLPNSYLRKLDEVIKNSSLLSPNIKKIICP